MKKVLFILPSLNLGGAEKVLCDVLKFLDPQRYDVTLLLIFRRGELLGKIPEHVRICHLYNQDYYTPGQLKFFHYLPGSRSILTKFLVWRRLGKKRFDTIVSFLEGEAVYIQSLIRSRACRNVSWVHTDLRNNHWTRYLFKDSCEESDCYSVVDEIVFVSKMAKEAFEHVFPNVHVPMSVVYNPIDINAIQRYAGLDPVPKKKFTLVAVGRLVPPKRFDRFLDVVSILVKRGHDIDAWIVGDGMLHNDIEGKIKQLDLADNVTMWGYQPNPYRFFKAADLCLLTSDVEGYSLVVAESSVVGTPVVSAPVTGPVELLQDGSGVISAFDADQLADDVERFIKDPVLLSDYGKKAANLSREKFDTAKAMKFVEEKL